MKDSWVDAEAKGEDDIQRELFADIERYASGETGSWETHPCLEKLRDSEREEFGRLLVDGRYKDYFLCIAGSHRSEPSTSVVASAWANSSVQQGLGRHPSGGSCRFLDQTHTGKREGHRPSQETEHWRLLGNEAPWTSFATKQRRFFLFLDFCKRVTHLPCLGDALSVLAQAHTGTHS